SGATRHLTRLGSECEFVIRTYVVSRLFYEADRGPRPAAQPENRPRRDLVAPVCFVRLQCSLESVVEIRREPFGSPITQPMAEAQQAELTARHHGSPGSGAMPS